MQIRPEQPGDEIAIRTVVDAAFAGAEHGDGTEGEIVERLRAARALTVSLVAVEGGAIVGHVAISPVTINGEDLGWFGLGPVAVSPDRQERGIGSGLVRDALLRLEADGAQGCVVLGEPGYYGRFGFVADPRLRYPGPPPQYFQALSFGGGVPAGTAAYHPDFG